MPSFWPFNLRRDSSVDQIPVAGLQDGVDAIDTIQWGSMAWTETLNTDSSGYVTLTHHPIDVSHDWQVDAQNVGRERKVDGADISAQTSGGATLYPGAANVATKRVPLFTDGALTAAAANLSGVVVTYRRLIPLTLDQNGNLVTVSGGGTGTVADISDRAARQVGQVSAVLGSVWDIQDRMARLLGRVQDIGGWSAVHAPGSANTPATCNVPGNAGVTHVCRSIAATLLPAATGGSPADVEIVLRDGPSGSGTVKWQQSLSISGAGGVNDRMLLGGLNIAGTAGNAMTLESLTGGGANNWLRVSLTGVDQ